MIVSIAQLVEHPLDKRMVNGSSPFGYNLKKSRLFRNTKIIKERKYYEIFAKLIN